MAGDEHTMTTRSRTTLRCVLSLIQL